MRQEQKQEQKQEQEHEQEQEQEQEHEQDSIDSDPMQPVVAMIKPDFNREALLAEIRRALG
jgi:PBP1b-binding outer membrane lipoprotein LpoB